MNMADKNYTLTFEMSDGTQQSVQFTAPQGPQGEKGETGATGATGAKGDKGNDGYTPVRGSDYWTSEDRETIQAEVNAYVTEELAKRGQLRPELANSVEECTDTAKLYVLPDGYLWAYMLFAENVPAIEIGENAGGYWYADEWNPTGAFNTNSSCCAKKTNLLPVTPGDQFAYKGYASGTPESVVWLDANQAYISEEKYNATGSAVTVTAPEGAAYVWFASFQYTSDVNNVVLDVQWVLCQAAAESYGWANTGHAFVPADYEDRILALEEKTADIEGGIGDALRDKKIVYDGDSICLGYHAGGGYPALIASATGGSYDNQAVGGARLCANDEKHSVVNDLANLSTEGDLYCFEGGINDFWGDTPIGECSPTDYTGAVDTSTICGAMETIFRYALTNFVGKPVCFVIVHKIQDTAYTANANGDTFEDYRDAMIQVCEKYSIPYYDAFNSSGLNGWNDAQNAAFLTANSAGTADGIHPNTDGYKRYYVPQLLALFRSIMPAE